MPRVLLVTYEFPPMGGVGVQRCLKLARYLPEAGWDVTVLTVDDPPSALMDAALLDELPPSVEIERAWSLEPTRLIQWWRRRKHEDPVELPREESEPRPAGKSLSGAPSWLIRFIQAFFMPDEKRLWRGPARRLGTRLMQAGKFDAILSSGPPNTAHLVALDLARSTGLPWVADLRDPWVGNYFFRPPSALHAWCQARWERSVVTSADRVVVVSEPMAASLRTRYPDLAPERFAVIPNGFDRSDLPAAASSPTETGPLQVVYLGAFQGAIAPDTFLRGLRAAFDSGFVKPQHLHVSFIGSPDPHVVETISACALEHAVEVTGQLSHREALERASGADVGLVVLPPGEAARPIVTGKLLEYLGLGLAVLAEAPESAARTLVENASAGIVVEPGDVAGMAAALTSLVSLKKTRSPLPAPDPEVVSRYERRKQAETYARLLDALVAREGAQ